jgi:hypothetical protein
MLPDQLDRLHILAKKIMIFKANPNELSEYLTLLKLWHQTLEANQLAA